MKKPPGRTWRLFILTAFFANYAEKIRDFGIKSVKKSK